MRAIRGLLERSKRHARVIVGTRPEKAIASHKPSAITAEPQPFVFTALLRWIAGQRTRGEVSSRSPRASPPKDRT